MTRAHHLLIPAVLLTVALTGCGGDSKPAAASSPTPTATSAAPSPSPSPPAAPTSAAALPKPPVDGGTYDSPLLLLDALTKGGVDCAGYQAVANPTGAIARGSCYYGGEEYTVGIYKSAAQARQQPNAMAELLKDVSDVDMVLGRNWTVGCPDQIACQRVAGVMGGEVFHVAA